MIEARLHHHRLPLYRRRSYAVRLQQLREHLRALETGDARDLGLWLRIGRPRALALPILWWHLRRDS